MTDSTDSRHLPPSALDEWLAAVAVELELDPETVPVGAVLDIARDVARGVARPAAPLTTFLVGLAVGRAAGGSVGRAAGGSADAEGAFEESMRRVLRLAEGWQPDAP